MNFVGFANIAHKAKFLLNQNSSTILTGVGVVGTVGTAYLTGRASFRAAGIITDELTVVNTGIDTENGNDPVFLTKKNKVKLVWKEYLPAVGTGVITVSAIVFAHRIDAKRVVALTVASGISERAFKEYREKVIEKLGDRQDVKLRDDIAQDRVNRTSGSELVIAGDGKVLCMDMLTGRYFMSSAEELKRAENKINHILNTQMGASLSEFFDEIGLSPTAYSEHVGWNPDRLVELKISATMSADDRPCLAVDFDPHPFESYWQLHE